MRLSDEDYLLHGGVPQNQKMTLTGHQTRSVFDRYDIVNEADLAEAVRTLGAAGAAITTTGTNGSG